ncbi:phosphatidylserine decarboxylase [Deinococcus sp.]|uniref:phosphatidylserine decarboxylase n=1 Tax=Deinococcus sp. TaxID=47478 RepID=UPI0025C5C3B4|nr:phosphatidylserine decarboxylase [Deinococcus sp.]
MRLPRRVLLLSTLSAGAVVYLRLVYRFRDPVRLPVQQPGGQLLSPADGVVSFIRRIDLGTVAGYDRPLAQLAATPAPLHEGWLVGVVVGPLDVHYTYLPTGGEVERTGHRAAEDQGSECHVPRLPQLLPLLAGQVTDLPHDLLPSEAVASNERYSYTLSGEAGRVTVTQIALTCPLQATTYLHEGDSVRAGNKATFLPEGGLVIVHLSADWRPEVEVGQRVVGAQTTLASLGG